MSVGVFFHHLREAARQENLTISEVVIRAASLGVSYVDIEGDHMMLNERELYDLLYSHGITVGCLDGRFDLAHDNGVKNAEELIRFAAAFQTPHVLLIPGQVKPGEERKQVMERIADNLRPLVRLGRELGVCCSLEDYDAPDTPYGTAEELLWYMERVDGLGCSFDTGNFAYFGQDALKAFEMLKPYIVLLHLKDRASHSLRGEQPTIAMDGVTPLYPCAVGEGDMPIKQIVQAFAGKNIGMTIEHFGANRQLELITRSVHNIHQWTTKA